MVDMRGIRREDLAKQLLRKMAPPLVALLSSPPEVQWVALRSVNLLLQKRPNLLCNEMRVFFCKYYDPLYPMSKPRSSTSWCGLPMTITLMHC